MKSLFKKEDMEKEEKGQAKILVVLIIIMIILILISLLWNIILGLLRPQAELAEIKMSLTRVNLKMKDPPVIFEDYINFTLKRGSERFILINRTVVYDPIDIDLMSVVDLSGSMQNNHGCTADLSSPCCTANNCLTQPGCESCGGIFNTTEIVCHMNFTAMTTCCSDNDCSQESECETCGGTFNSSENRCYISPILLPCCQSISGLADNCTNQLGCGFCGGVFNSYNRCVYSLSYSYNDEIYIGKTFEYESPYPVAKVRAICNLNETSVFHDRVYYLQEANRLLLNEVLSHEGNHRVGFVAFGTLANNPRYNHDLSSNKDSLTETIDKWYWDMGQTYINQGVDEAVNILKNSRDFKAIVVISDGQATVSSLAIESARIAWETHEIRVYTIGLELPSGNSTLINMSIKGNGEYSESNVSILSEVYNQTIKRIIKEYEAEQKWDHLKIVFYNKTTSWIYEFYDVPQPLETKEISIPPEQNLKEYITNITKVEVYMSVYTSEGQEVISPLLDKWELEDF